MNYKTGNHRVLLVFFLFVPLSFLAMWFIGGTEQTLELTVDSSLTPVQLQQRLDRILSDLQPISQQELALRTGLQSREGSLEWQNRTSQVSARRTEVESRDYRKSMSPNMPAGLLTGLPHSNSVLTNAFPLADIVLPTNSAPTTNSEIDPTIIYRDPEFSDALAARNWLGKDHENIYLEELDHQKNLRLVRLQKENLTFKPALIDGEAGTKITYKMSICHEGFKRIYGRFFERECESTAKSRLEWIRRELETE